MVGRASDVYKVFYRELYEMFSPVRKKEDA